MHCVGMGGYRGKAMGVVASQKRKSGLTGLTGLRTTDSRVVKSQNL